MLILYGYNVLPKMRKINLFIGNITIIINNYTRLFVYMAVSVSDINLTAATNSVTNPIRMWASSSIMV